LRITLTGRDGSSRTTKLALSKAVHNILSPLTVAAKPYCLLHDVAIVGAEAVEVDAPMSVGGEVGGKTEVREWAGVGKS
jgi:hypothetical protein